MWGLADTSKHEIVLDDVLKTDRSGRAVEVLIHEILHVIEDQTRVSLPEEDIHRMSVMLSASLINAGVVKR